MTKTDVIASRVKIVGRGKAARLLAFTSISALSFAEATSRGESIANLRNALGNAPTDAELRVARDEWVIGRVAFRLPASELPKGKANDPEVRLETARTIVCDYASFPKPGAKARKLRAGQKGRRNQLQQKLVNAGNEAWSQMLAELGIGTAKTQGEKNAQKKTRAPSMAGTGKGKAPAPATPATLQQLATPAKALTAEEAMQHITTQAAALQAFAQKNAKLLPTDFGVAVTAFKQAINKANNAYGERKALAEAKAAEKTK